MSILSRISAATRAKINEILDDAEDPYETLDYAFEHLMETIRDTHRLKEEIPATKYRLQLQAFNINGSIGALHTEALRAVANDKEEIARITLQRRQASLFIVEALHQTIIDLDHEEQNLTSAALQVMKEMESFQASTERLQTQPTASPEERTQIRSLIDNMQQEEEHLSLAVSQAKHVLDNIDQPEIPEDFSEKDAVRIIRDLAPLSVAQNIEDELAYLKTLNPAP